MTLNTQEASLSNDYGFSQSDSRISKPHKKSRLARSRHHLTSHEEEPQNDLVSPQNDLVSPLARSLTSPPPPTTPTSRTPQRKISYTAAIQEAPVLSGGNMIHSSLIESEFDGSTGQPLSPLRSNYKHKNRWSAEFSTSRVLDTEIISPSSKSDWTSSWTATGRPRVSSVVGTRYHHAPESRL